MGILSLNHVQLGYPKALEEPVRHFYGAQLALRPAAGSTAGSSRFLVGSQRIDLVAVDTPELPRSPGHVAFEVLNLPELRHKLLTQGLTLDESRPLSGHRRFYVQDPAGNTLEFLEPEPTGVWTV